MATVKKTIKKAQVGDTLVKKYPSVKMTTSKGYNTQETTYPGGAKKTLKYKVKKAQDGVIEKKSLKDKIFGTKEERQDRRLDRQNNREDRQLSREENREDRILRRQCVGGKCGGKARGFIGYKDGGKVMMKRADGSTSQRGLWDNIRSAAKKNKAAGKPGKKPTSAMLKQEKKIKSQTKKK